MAKFDSADILARIKLALNRPATDAALGDPDLYSFATLAQDHVAGTLAGLCPEPMYNALTLLTTADSGASFTFGNDADTAAIHAFGHYELYPTLNSFPDGPLIEGIDFIWEGSKVRIPNGRTISTPYGRWVAPPHLLASGSEPTLLPKYARILIVDWACVLASEQRLKQAADAYRASYDTNLARILLTMKTSASGLGGRANSRRAADVGWWKYTGDLG